MKESAVDRINKQFIVLSDSGLDFLIKECIEPAVLGRKITLRNDVKCPSGERSLKSQKYFNSCRQYVAFYKSRSYQFLFVDHSLGRFDYEFDDEDHLLSYNLYWNPCPFSPEFMLSIKECDLDVSDYIDNIDKEEKIELENISLRTPIRLDYTAMYNGLRPEYHPDFHVHFQNKNTRAKTENIISLYSYILFVLENCYPDLYSAKEYQEHIEKLQKLNSEAQLGFRFLPRGRNSSLGNNIHSKFGL